MTRRPSLTHWIEYLIADAARRVFRSLPVDAGSDAVAALARTVGPRLGPSRRIRSNLRFVWPDMPEDERERLVAAVWDMTSRQFYDYCNLDRIRAEEGRRLEVDGGGHFDALRGSGRPGVLFTAHTGNWEMIPLAARRHGLDLTVVNRTIDNPLIGRFVKRAQNANGADVIFKGRDGTRRLVEIVAGGGHALLLVDVRLAAGVAVPFLDRIALTPSGPATLALNHDALLVPVRTERTAAARFRVTVEPPRPPVATGDRDADVRATMTWVNERIGAWIRARPEQWFWFHRRWGKDPERDQAAYRARVRA